MKSLDRPSSTEQAQDPRSHGKALGARTWTDSESSEIVDHILAIEWGGGSLAELIAFGGRLNRHSLAKAPKPRKRQAKEQPQETLL